MKTLINSVKSNVIAIILLASLFSINASAATVTLEKGALTTDIKKVVVTGNTKVILIQAAAESVNVDEADLNKVSVKQLGNTLTISSAEKNPVTVVVYVKDIYRIDASGKSSVNTAGKFAVKALQVMLKGDASARVKVKTESLYTVINDHANLQLIGTSDNHISKISGLAKMDTNKFAALKTEDVNTLAGVTASASDSQNDNLSK
ncbi:GIN domain-containing protein [Pedobacter sp. L105]|uniref:GIN domain-containing protein n=1 Tax=Pedobacter sp. L105 TaxID=1641871 RepID=UPI00131DD475|nr:DUF2807 domain-containing protein [Pedobacter sp. L105]